jgi:hypothetical protein
MSEGDSAAVDVYFGDIKVELLKAVDVPREVSIGVINYKRR